MNPVFRRIAVLAGGPSCEREVSLISGKAVHEALTGQGFSTFLIDSAGDFISELKAEGTSCVFIALHGVFGEDGTVQRLLEQAEIPYTGPGIEMSEKAFDKSKAQVLFREAGVCIPEFQCVGKDDFDSIKLLPKFPLFVKPAKAGSSVGISMVTGPEEYRDAVQEALRYSDIVLVEECIRGRELTVGILGGEALPVVEIIPKRQFYDYEAKYKESGTRYEFPAKLTDKQASNVTAMAIKAYHALGGEVMGRADILLDAQDRPFVLELNTIPGLTGKSLLPKAAKAKGIDFPELCVRILELSMASKRYGQTIKN